MSTAATAIRLPLTAIHHGQAGDGLARRRADLQVAPRAVELGSAQNDAVLVASGLAGGETVVTAGVHMLHAGQRVKWNPRQGPGRAQP